MRQFLLTLLGFGLATLAGCKGIQRDFLFFPTHRPGNNGLSEWRAEGEIIGYSRQVPAPDNVWLMIHGNAGQAADRVYALGSFSGRDSVFILEYPGYGVREGKPSRASFDTAAIEAYTLLRDRYPNAPVCVMGESIGSGPACLLATRPSPPDKIVLVAPFDKLGRVAARHTESFVPGLIMEAKWDNIRSLSRYSGPVEIFGARGDKVIPIAHAEKLAGAVPSARLHSIPGGHNDWAARGRVAIRNP